MIVSLFDIQNGKVVPTVHAYTLSFLKDIMDKYPDTYIKIYEYLFYMTCPNPELNPFFNLPEEDKESTILQEIKINFSLDDELILNGLEMCKKLYATPTSRAHDGAKAMLDKISKYLNSTSINANSKDGNGTFILAAMKNLTDMRRTYKDAYKDLEEEQKSHIRGNQNIAYDQE